MQSKILFIISDETGKSLSKVAATKKMLAVLGLCFGFCMTLLGFIIYDYYGLKQDLVCQDDLERKVAGQSDIIYQQKKQVRKFAAEINTLKSELTVLNEFQKKIRIIANLETDGEQDGLFGVGGPMPEDLDPDLSFKENSGSLVREMHEQVEQLNTASVSQKNAFESLLQGLELKRNLLACTPAIRPTNGWISSKFGYRKSPFTSLKELHKGIDFAAPKGTPVIATADGVVTFSGTKGLLGKLVVIDHGHGLVTRYGHNSKIFKKRGDKVKRGDIIAEVGSTGRSTGPHVHYEVRLNGVPINPSRYIYN